MPTITIGNAAGNYDFDVSDFSLKAILDADSELIDTELEIGGKTATGWLSFSTGFKGQVITVDGTFISKGIFSDGPAHAVKEIDQATISKGKTLVTMTDLGLTGDDLKTDASFASYLNSQHYTINGNSFDNVIVGGASTDTLAGGAGDDTYYITDGDKIVETASKSGGFDTVAGDMNLDLSQFHNVEALLLTGKADLKGTGDAGNNTLTGNDGDNVLDGGKGADKLIGGDGDDTYIVDNAKDVVVEDGGKSDHDIVKASASFDIGKIKFVEDVFLIGKADIDATGNKGDNVLSGNTGDNELTGGKGVDHFEFTKGGHADTITDFDAKGSDHDFIDLSDYGRKALKFANLDIEKVKGGDVVIDFGKGDTLHLHFDGSNAKDLDASDFIF